MEFNGYVGGVLHIDLSTGEVWREDLNLEDAEKFIGGFGLNNKLFYDVYEPGMDPLSPENPIIIGAGPLVGTSAPGASKVAATTKFPLTGAIATAIGGMNFAPILKWTGYDHMIVTGRSEDPVYLLATENGAEICDADRLWGRDIFDTTDWLHDTYNGCSVISIGPAGENLVSFSLSMVDKMATLGRGGLGAVMGSKNLKAIVARGGNGVKISDGKKFKKMINGLHSRLRDYPFFDICVDKGVMANWGNYVKQLLTYKNWSEVYPAKEATEKAGPEVYEKVKKKRIACPSCFIADKDILEIRDGKFEGLVTHTTSFLNSAITTALYDTDYRRGIKLEDTLDRYGLGMITFGRLGDFIITLYERGLVTKEDICELTPTRNFDSAMELADKVTFRKGFGDILAEGWIGTIEAIGSELEKYANIIKGQDLIFEPRVPGVGTMEFEQIVCPRGPTSGTAGSPTYIPNFPLHKFKSHCDRMGASQEIIDRIFNSSPSPNIGRLSVLAEDWYSVLSSLGICNRHMNNRFYSAELCSKLYSALTGIQISREDLMKAASRSWNLFKVLNVKEGFSRKDDTIPDVWFEPLRVEGKEARLMDFTHSRELMRDDLEDWLDDYYDERNWDVQKGIPTRRTLKELDLGGVAQNY